MEPTVVRTLHAVLAMLALALVVLIVAANLGCAPKYFQRGDVLGLLGLGVLYAVALARAALSDTDQRRALGAITSAGLAALFLSTASVPVLAAPAAIAGVFRLPRSAVLRRRVIIVLPAAVLLTVAVPSLGGLGMTADQFRCP